MTKVENADYAADIDNSANQSNRSTHTRRGVVTGLLALSVAGCAGGTNRFDTAGQSPYQASGRYGARAAALYGARPNEPYPIPAVDVRRINPRYLRQRVEYYSEEPPGTIIVDTDQRFLYLVMPAGEAMRYGIGIGRQGFSWNGRARVGDKQEWPKWFPPKEMREREPELEQYAGGMEPGLQNPLGARALYLYQGKKDTLYRLHGTSEVDSIGRAVSSGCIRLLHQDIIDLHRRVPIGAEVVVV